MKLSTKTIALTAAMALSAVPAFALPAQIPSNAGTAQIPDNRSTGSRKPGPARQPEERRHAAEPRSGSGPRLAGHQ